MSTDFGAVMAFSWQANKNFAHAQLILVYSSKDAGLNASVRYNGTGIG